MKKIVLILCLLLVSFSGYAQRVNLANTGNQKTNIRKICINDSINKPEYQKKVLENTRINAPEVYAKMISVSLRKTEQAAQVGDKKDFFVLNTLTSTFETVRATLKASGTLSNIWVDTTEMTNNHVTMTEINTVLINLETSTPSASRNPEKGIVAIDNEYYGDPPNYDGDGKVDFLVCNIKDSFDGSGDYVAGFFFSNDQKEIYGSNKRDILYIDTYPSIYFNGERRLSVVLQTTAHEYQHLIHYNYDKSELTFVNEAASQNAEAICGYDVFNSVLESDYFSTTNTSLFDWQGRISDYSRATLWLLYLTEQLGDTFLKKLVQNSQTGLSGINSALSQSNSIYTFQQHLVNWNVANYVKDKTYNSLYGYDYPVQSKPSAKLYSDPNVAGYTDYVYLYGAKYIIFNSQSKEFKYKFTSERGNLSIKMMAFGPNGKKVQDVSLGVEYMEPEFKTNYETIVFVITNTGYNPWSDFTLRTSGTMVLENDEIAYDSGTPQTIGETGIGYLFTSGAPFGGWAVKFYPKNNENRLKRIKFSVGFDQEVPPITVPENVPRRFQVHVWKAKNDSTPGADLITPFIYQSYRTEISEEFIDIDLAAYKDKLTNLIGPIFVGFLEDDEYLTGLAISNAASPENYTYFRGVEEDSVWKAIKNRSIEGVSLSGWNAMIRALFVYYVSTGVEETVEEMPSSYSLAQNYPNPFNPSTKIEYTVPKTGNVKIVIYDILGRNIKTLINEIHNGGKYSVVWNGDNNLGRRVASGLYFYRLEAESFTSIKKLNLIK